jgi:CubicO group peptidase (beta-lactamase class C family)
MSEQLRRSTDAIVDAVRYFDSWLAFRQGYDQIPGIQAAVWCDGELLLSAAYGHADIENGARLTPQHLFRVASHSKTFTATAILQLVERGVLRLDDTAVRWLPFLQGAPIAAITIHELLAHGGGIIRDGRDGDFWQLAAGFPNEGTLRTVALDGAHVRPTNERFKYSNIGYSILGLIITAAAGQPYATYIREHIIDALSLSNTGPEYEPSRAAEYATGYTGLAYANRRIPIDHADTAAMAAATGLFSTAEDLVRYFSAHAYGDDRLISDTSKRRMHRAEWKVDGRNDEYGLGFIRPAIAGRTVVGHLGAFPGYRSKTYVDPVDRLAVCVLANAIDAPIEVLASAMLKVMQLALTSGSASTHQATANDIDPTRFTGRFANIWGVFDIAYLGQQLYLIDPTLDDPTDDLTTLTVIDERTLCVTSGVGYHAVGEPLNYDFSKQGITSVSYQGMTGRPLQDIQTTINTCQRIHLGTWPIKSDGADPTQ